MPDLAVLTAKLAAGQELATAEVRAAAHALAAAEVTAEAKADFLAALAQKGETPGEVAAFAMVFRELARNPGVERWAGEAIDIVGTGGDHAGGFNISTVVVLALAAAGVKVMKHGNRGITSPCGSADLFAALGVDLEAPVERLQASLDRLGYAFFFAPAYHPAFKQIAPVRKALAARGQRTVFNILGPLINPGRPAHMLIGAFSEAWVAPLAAALDRLGARAALVGHGVIADGRGIDEITTATDNLVRGAGRLGHVAARWRPEEFGFARAPVADLLGGDCAQNLRVLAELAEGRGPAGLRDTVVLNVAISLWIVGRTGGVAEGVSLARDLFCEGAVKRKIAETREFWNQN
jgi:anthranilate phosphoribosyltransferase